MNELNNAEHEMCRSIIRNEGVNTQAFCVEPPEKSKQEIRLLILDEKYGMKQFICTHALKELLERKSEALAYGTTNSKGRKAGIVISWF